MPADQAHVLRRVNIGIIAVCSVLLLVCLVRQLWLPAVVNLFFIGTNVVQLVGNRSRP